MATAVGAIAIPAILSAVQDNVILPKLQEQAGANIQGTEGVIATNDPAKIGAALEGVRTSVASLSGLQKILYDLNANGVKTHTEGLVAALSQALVDSYRKAPKPTEELARLNAVRDKIESSKNATVPKLAAVRDAITRGDAALAATIRQSVPIVNVKVAV